MTLQEKIKSLLGEKNVIPLYADQLESTLDASKSEMAKLNSTLDEMVQNGELILTKKKKFALPEKFGFLVGRLQGNAKGFAFLIPDNEEEEDVFISAENAGGALHNDRVMVRLLKNSDSSYLGSHSREGEVTKVLTRANKTIVGTFEDDKHFGFVIPDDKRINQDIFIPKNMINGAKTDYKVVVELVKWPEKRRNPEGTIIEVLGHKNDSGTDILSIIRQYELPEEFPEKVAAEARKVSGPIPDSEIKRRNDLRGMRMVTIDGTDAKDFDDAVSIDMLDNGNYLLGVHIADVSYYVKEKEIIDKEAYKRGTSIYLVDRVIPMLPKELSNGICSLNPHADRLAVSVLMEVNKKGKVIKHDISESIIRSSERMIYEDVTKILDDNDPELSEKYNYLVDDFRHMEDLSKILREKRRARGSIDFDIDETTITLNDAGKPTYIGPYERGTSNKIIEEFMLVCNETIAEFMFQNQAPFVYRIHEEPDVEKILDFNEFIHNFGYHLKGIGGKIHPKALQSLLEDIKGTKEEAIISTVMLRSLKKAVYSPENRRHFGLAATYYTHFTSPIRRYPDLIVHRIIKDFINGRLDKKRTKYLESVLPEMTEHCSERERLAVDVERETDDLKMAEFMLDKIGEEYDGIISGVTNYGLYVALENTIEGLVRMTALEDDYYVYNEKHYCLIGERTRKIYRLGDAIRIKVSNVDMAQRNIDFVLADENR